MVKPGTAITVIWSGVALASDGYNAQVLGNVLPMLKKLYPNEWNNTVSTRISTAYYVGVCLGAVFFGIMIDRMSRKAGVIFATLVLLLGIGLCSGAWGTGPEHSAGWAQGMFWMLTISRGVLGFGAGGEYPVCSVNATEAGDESPALRKRRGLLVGLCGCTAIDCGIVAGGIIPLIVLAGYGYTGQTPSSETAHLDKAWRIILALGAIVPIFVFYFRWKMTTSSAFERHKQSQLHMGLKGWWIVVKAYKWRIIGTCLPWALYDAVAYPFGLFTATIIDGLSGGTNSLIHTIGYGCLINAFNIPGCIVGSFCLDKIGRRNTQMIGFFAQAVLAFVLGGAIKPIQSVLPLFIILYGILLALGEAGPGVTTLLVGSECFP